MTVTASLDTPESAAVTVVTPLPSEIDDEDSASVTVGSVSSSVKVSVTLDGAATLLPPDTVAETVTVSSGSSVVSCSAVTVTAPVLVVSPDAIVSVFAVLSVKSDPEIGVVDTVTVTASLDATDSVAVTVATPPVSEIDADDRTSATLGNASSSVKVSVTSGGAATPLPPEAVPETVTDLSGASTAFPFAVTVTAPVLAVCPAAIVSVVALDSAKSAAAAFVPGAAETVTVTASLDLTDSVAVTVDTPPVSEIDADDRTSATIHRQRLVVGQRQRRPGHAPRPLVVGGRRRHRRRTPAAVRGVVPRHDQRRCPRRSPSRPPRSRWSRPTPPCRSPTPPSPSPSSPRSTDATASPSPSTPRRSPRSTPARPPASPPAPRRRPLW